MLDSNIHVLEWELRRSNKKIDLTRDYIPGSMEWEEIRQFKRRYTAFNDMLRYTKSMATEDYIARPEERIKWDLKTEYGYEHTPNRTAELYEERAKDKKERTHHE